MIWKPDITVAAIIERDGRFLLVEEHTEHGRRFNQPAGHLDPGESLIRAVDSVPDSKLLLLCFRGFEHF
jgi:8-oxo-dGTP pyrophosphatase MutT (NUDIX family)